MSDNRKNPGIKIPFLDITDKPIVEGTRCVEIRIPDDDAYMPVLAGLVAIATKWFNWQRDDTHKGTQIAKLWQIAYILTDWGSCMNCEELIACLQPVLDAQTAEIINQVTNNVMNFQQFGTQTPGLPMTTEQLETNLAEGTNPTCDYDILWAQSLAIVQFTNRAITDLFEQIESASNAVELLDVFDDAPIVTWISDTIGAEFAEGLANYYQEAVAEGYLAQYTESVEIELACAVFCDARVDCAITVDLLYSVFYSRVQLLIPDDPSDALELLLIVAGIAPTGTTVVDLMFWFPWAAAKLMSFFVSDALSSIVDLQMLLNLAVNDANNDWILLCDCPEFWCVSLTGGNGLDTLFAPFVGGPGIQAQWSGTGWQATAAVPGRITLEGDFGSVLHVYKAEVYCTEAITVGTDRYQQFSNSEGGLDLFEEAEELAVFEFSPTDIRYTFLDRVPSTADPLTPAAPGEIYEIRLYGIGTPPEIGEPCENLT